MMTMRSKRKPAVSTVLKMAAIKRKKMSVSLIVISRSRSTSPVRIRKIADRRKRNTAS